MLQTFVEIWKSNKCSYICRETKTVYSIEHTRATNIFTIMCHAAWKSCSGGGAQQPGTTRFLLLLFFPPHGNPACNPQICVCFGVLCQSQGQNRWSALGKELYWDWRPVPWLEPASGRPYRMKVSTEEYVREKGSNNASCPHASALEGFTI